jgi:FecR protein
VTGLDGARGGCGMAPLVEARHDGRLGEREGASLDRHLGGCAECRALAASLDRLSALVQRPLVPVLSPLERQRGRSRLLREAALGTGRPSAPVRPPMQLPRWKAALAAAVLVLGALAAGRGLGPHRAEAPAPQAAGPARTETTLHPSEGAHFDRAQANGVDVVRLSSGAMDIGVRPLHEGERFLVRTGDAEVEVRGTLFHVAVEEDRLRSVDVTEGKVEVRYAGMTVLVGAGSSWRAPSTSGPQAAPVAMGPQAAPVTMGPQAAPNPRPDEPAVIAGADGGATGLSASVPKASATATKANATATKASARAKASAATANATPIGGLADGVDLIERGDYGAAAERLQAFQRGHAGDASAEDAAYLTIVALQRAGRRSAAVSAAKEYLSSYPNGRRRAEAQAIASSAAVP